MRDDTNALENIAADIPEALRAADRLLSEYGRWAVTRSRNRPATVDRKFIREADRSESLEAYIRRRQAIPQSPLMPVQQAMQVQRALARVPDRERIVLAILYVPRKISAAKQLEILRIPPKLSRVRHLAGLRMFDNLYRMAQLAGRS